MREQTRNQIPRSEPASYATREDFISVFNEDGKALYQLSFLLTADQEKAEKCFVAGIEHCVKHNRVFREWARTWAKRIIIENAIRELKPHPRPSTSSFVPTVFARGNKSSDSSEHFDVDAVLRLENFERFAFVMSILEHYSEHECALLLGCSVLQIRQGRLRALEDLARSRQAVSFAH
jgi:DNA-directed RNA polymerase specialized sigma24 family protein